MAIARATDRPTGAPAGSLQEGDSNGPRGNNNGGAGAAHLNRRTTVVATARLIGGSSS